MNAQKTNASDARLVAQVNRLSAEVRALNRRHHIYSLVTLFILLLSLLTTPVGLQLFSFLGSKFNLEAFFNECLVALVVALISWVIGHRVRAKKRGRKPI